jgi:hypothetical protein
MSDFYTRPNTNDQAIYFEDFYLKKVVSYVAQFAKGNKKEVRENYESEFSEFFK